MDKIKFSKQLLLFYKIVVVLAPIILLLLNFFNTEVEKKAFIKEHGYLDERFFLDGVGMIYIIVGLLIIILIPFYIWIYFLNKNIKDILKRKHLIQISILTVAPVLVILIGEIVLFAIIIINYVKSV